jgi:hypothetical protein
MRARQVFMDSLVAHGVDSIFGNPGTTESPLLDSLIDYPQIAYYVALHEGVAVCAASFYAKASKKTALANLHVAPGLGNAIGMMYAALKAGSPLIVALEKPAALARSGSHGRTGHEVECRAPEGGRDGAIDAAGVQNRQRAAGGAGVRGIAHRCHG